MFINIENLRKSYRAGEVETQVLKGIRLQLDRLKFPTKFKVREQARSLSRLAFLLLGVVLATMLLLLGFTAKSSMNYLLNDSLKNTFQFRHEYVYNALHTEKPPVNAEPFSVSTFALKSDEKAMVRICGIQPASVYISLKNASGADLGKDRIIMTRRNARVPYGKLYRIVDRGCAGYP